MTAVFTLLFGVVAIGLVIAANGYFVAQEFAYMSVDRTELRARAEDGDPRAARALKITDRTSFMLSGAQLGITVTGLLVGFLVEPLVGASLGALLGGVGIPRAVSVGVGTVLALAVSTVVQMIFAELFPKNYAIAAPVKSSLALARSTSIYLKATGWIIAFFDVSSNALLKAFRIEPVEDVDSSATADDLDHIVASSRELGALDDRTYYIVDRLLDFPGRSLGHAMIPRSRVDSVSGEDTIASVRERMATGHTRYPVIDGAQAPVGTVHLLDVLDAELDGERPVRDVMRPAVVMPDVMALPDALEHLQLSGEKMACVIDEYGGFIGIVTVEDLAEEILGDVTDEHDAPPASHVTPAGENAWLVQGDTPADEVERIIGCEIPGGEYETIAGFVLAHAGQLLAPGEVVRVELPRTAEDYLQDEAPLRVLQVRVDEVEHHVPSAVRLTVAEEVDEPGKGVAER